MKANRKRRPGRDRASLLAKRVWTKAKEREYRQFNSITKIQVPGILGGKDTKLMHRGRIVSEAYVRRLAKKELYMMRVEKRRKDGVNV